MQGVLLAALLAASGDTFAREEWIYSFEPTHAQYWGTNWGVNSFLLPYRVVQRGKRELERRYLDDGRMGDGEGGALYRIGSTGLEFGLYMAGQNIHHAMGHDARARELANDYPALGLAVPDRFDQILPRWLGGEELELFERNIPSGGADVQSLLLVTPMEAENEFAHAAARSILGRREVNPAEMANFLFHRLRFLDDYRGEWRKGELVQAALTDPHGTGGARGTDFTHYVREVNNKRYGVANLADFKFSYDSIEEAYALQLLDPVFLLGAWRYAKDYVIDGKARTSLPMLRMGEDLEWLPGLRVYFSPFGKEYYLDNHLRWRGLSADVFLTTGANEYEDRFGGGFEVDGIDLLSGRATLGVFAEAHRQPLLTHIFRRTALSSPEIGRDQTVWNAGASARVPFATWDEASGDPAKAFLYLRGGAKSDGWIPGEYLRAGGYLQTGLGLRW